MQCTIYNINETPLLQSNNEKTHSEIIMQISWNQLNRRAAVEETKCTTAHTMHQCAISSCIVRSFSALFTIRINFRPVFLLFLLLAVLLLLLSIIITIVLHLHSSKCFTVKLYFYLVCFVHIAHSRARACFIWYAIQMIMAHADNQMNYESEESITM